MELSPGTVIVPRKGADAEIERDVAMVDGFDSGPLLWQGRALHVGATVLLRSRNQIFRSIENRW